MGILGKLFRRKFDIPKDYVYCRGYYMPSWLKGTIRYHNLIIKPLSGQMDRLSIANYVWSMRLISKERFSVDVGIYRCVYKKCINDCKYCEELSSMCQHQPIHIYDLYQEMQNNAKLKQKSKR